jgi:hypothetical protein
MHAKRVDDGQLPVEVRVDRSQELVALHWAHCGEGGARPATDLAGPAASSSWVRVAFLSYPGSADANAPPRDSFPLSRYLTRYAARRRRGLMVEVV